VEAGSAGQAGHRHPDIGRVVEQDRGGVGVLADLLPYGRYGAVDGAGGEADGDLAVVPDAGRDGIAGGALGQQHDWMATLRPLRTSSSTSRPMQGVERSPIPVAGPPST